MWILSWVNEVAFEGKGKREGEREGEDRRTRGCLLTILFLLSLTVVCVCVCLYIHIIQRPSYVQRIKKHPEASRHCVPSLPPSLTPFLPPYSAKQLCTFCATTRAFARSFGVRSLRLFPPKITNPSLLSNGCNTTA